MDNNTHICVTTADLERRLAASHAELSAARAQVASLQRQPTLRVEAVAFAVVAAPEHPGCVYPAGQRCHGEDRCQFPARCERVATMPSEFSEQTRRRAPAVIRREPVTKVHVVPCVEVQP
jgi:hypothetical protein